MQLVERMSRLGVESAFEVLVRARGLEAQGKNIIHLEIGEPDFPSPTHVIEAAKKALDDGFTKYGPVQGLPELRAAIAASVTKSHGIQVGPEHVSVVPGAKPILYFAMTALVGPGDEVIYPDPGFPIYESLIHFLGAKPVPVPLLESRGFSFDLDVLRDSLSDRTKLVILNSPHNPTGGVIPDDDLAEVAAMLRDRDVMVISDEIYTRIAYETKPKSIASFEGMQEKTIIADGFSKTYAMTGWRLGYGVMPVWLVNAINLLMVNSNSCTASFVQRAGIAALEGPQDCVDAMVAEFRRRRDAIHKGLNEVPGFRCPLPAGAFYAFANVEGTGRTSKEIADILLNEAGVACLNGGSFGKHGEGYVRFSYANSLENIQEAVARIRRAASLWTR
ncbi:MAG: pyridoxal phosphate-dependent aminotransferase [Bryobacteraceae bacterium]